MAATSNHIELIYSPAIRGQGDLFSGATLSIHSGATLQITSGATFTVGGDSISYQVWPRITSTTISGATQASAAKATAKTSVGTAMPAGAAILAVWMRVKSGYLASGVATHSNTAIRVGLSGISSTLFVKNEEILSGKTAAGLRNTLSNAADHYTAKAPRWYILSGAAQVKATMSHTGANTSDISRGIVKVYVAYIPSALGDTAF